MLDDLIGNKEVRLILIQKGIKHSKNDEIHSLKPTLKLDQFIKYFIFNHQFIMKSL